MKAVNDSKSIVEIHKEDAINAVYRDIKGELTGSSVKVQFNLDGDWVEFDIQRFSEQFHIAPKTIAEDSPQLPELQEWYGAFEDGDIRSFGQSIDEDIGQHEFTTTAVSYDEQYYEEPRDENVNKREVIVKIVD